MLAELLHALAHFYEARAGTDEIPMLDTVAEVLFGITEGESPIAPEPGPLPVVRLLEGVDPGSDGLLAAFLSVALDLPWTQTRAYVDSLPAEFLDNYGYVRLVGSAAVVHSERASIGIGVWGAGLRYPPHVHPAEETYHVLAGDVEFRGADGVYRALGPGDVAHNGPSEPHELRFGDRTCVVAWAWTGEIGVDARLVG